MTAENNRRRRTDKLKDQVFSFVVGVLLSMAVTAGTLYVKLEKMDQRLANVEKTLSEITTISVKDHQ